MAHVTFIPQTEVRGARLVWPQSCGLHLELGMSLRQVISQLREAELEMEIAYDPNNPFGVDVVVELAKQGLRLRFDPFYQRLRLIDVFNLAAITLFRQAAFSGSSATSFGLVTAIFGPTYPGYVETSELSDVYVLQYPGLRFDFPVPPNLAPHYNNQDLAFSPPQGAPPACRLFIFFGFDVTTALLPPLPTPATLLASPMTTLPYMEEVEVVFGHEENQPGSTALSEVVGKADKADKGAARSTATTVLRFPRRRPRHEISTTAPTKPTDRTTGSDAAARVAGEEGVTGEEGHADGELGAAGAESIRLHHSTPQDVMALLGAPDLVPGVQYKHALLAKQNLSQRNLTQPQHGFGRSAAGVGGVEASGAGAGDRDGGSGAVDGDTALNPVGGGSGGEGQWGGGGPFLGMADGGGGGLGGGGDGGDVGGTGSDYFYGYPDAGIDVQFCGKTHTVRKVHLVTNLPGHPSFLDYDRCNFSFANERDDHHRGCSSSSSSSSDYISQPSQQAVLASPAPTPPALLSASPVSLSRSSGGEQELPPPTAQASNPTATTIDRAASAASSSPSLLRTTASPSVTPNDDDADPESSYSTSAETPSTEQPAASLPLTTATLPTTDFEAQETKHFAKASKKKKKSNKKAPTAVASEITLSSSTTSSSFRDTRQIDETAVPEEDKSLPAPSRIGNGSVLSPAVPPPSCPPSSRPAASASETLPEEVSPVSSEESLSTPPSSSASASTASPFSQEMGLPSPPPATSAAAVAAAAGVFSAGLPRNAFTVDEEHAQSAPHSPAPPPISFHTPWSGIEDRLFGPPQQATSGDLPGGSRRPLQPAVHSGDGAHPFGPTLIYCGEPSCRALFEVTQTGRSLCVVTLY